MENVASTPEKARRAVAALDRALELLQSAHFAARDFEEQMPAGRFLRTELLTDRIHQLRQSAEILARDVEVAIRRLL